MEHEDIKNQIWINNDISMISDDFKPKETEVVETYQNLSETDKFVDDLFEIKENSFEEDPEIKTPGTPLITAIRLSSIVMSPDFKPVEQEPDEDDIIIELRKSLQLRDMNV